jgi:hypothetical protein
MIWLTWRQFRPQAIVAAAALAVVAVALAVTGPHLASMYTSSGLASCHAGCGTQASTFITAVKGSATELIFYGGIFLLYATPALIGMFWAAPLVTRELEAGTFRLAWSQSVTRTRWIAVKLGLIGLAAMATAGLLSLMISWWASPLDRAAQKTGQNSLSISKIAPPLFSATGIAPIGYAAFAFALGVTFGVLVRRTLPAMAITLAVFAAVQIFWPGLVRQHLISPVSTTYPFNPAQQGFSENVSTLTDRMTLSVQPVNEAGAWTLSNQAVITPAGHAFTGPATQACLGNSTQACNAWLASKHLRVLISYQPASRYWDFQWIETGLFLVLALGLGGVCYWRVRRLS